jgi:transposase-like protein
MNRDIRAVNPGRITRSGRAANRYEYDEGILECDESKFGKQQKYHKGKITRRYWVFGLAQRNTRKTMFKVVQQRNASTLIPLITEVAMEGSTIYSDEWRAYNTLKDDYHHKTVCHKREFKSKEGVCTNLIEGKL